tara:strand:- start:218 stop:1213 length:996 start_codon:yes stop_codon:yes gene_type:complete
MNYTSLQSKRIDLSTNIPLQKPFTIYIEPTNICNFKCNFCPHSLENFKEESGGVFSLSEKNFNIILNQIKEFQKISTLNLHYMGEPFVNKNIIKFISLAKKANVSKRVIVTSNGSLIKENIFSDLCKSNLDYLRVSIYAGSETKHNTTTKSKIPLKKILEQLTALHKFKLENNFKKPHVYIKMIRSEDEEENNLFFKDFKNAGNEIELEDVMDWNSYDKKSFLNIPKKDFLKQETMRIKKEVCPFPFYTLVVHADLNVSVCCVDWNKKTVVGSLKKNTLKEIWLGKKLRYFQRMHLTKRAGELEGCKNCAYLHTARDNLDNVSKETLSKFL